MKTILLLEDESFVMKLLRHMLDRYSLIEATTAAQALQLFTERDRQIDLLVADLTLPTSSGIQVALVLRAGNPGLPVILTSGYPVSDWSARDSEDLESLGGNTVTIIQKPFPGEVLSNAVWELIGEAQSEKARTA